MLWIAHCPECKPCPFCGVLPDLHEALQRQGVWAIHCFNPGCFIRPGTAWYSGADGRVNALEAWNTREKVVADGT